MMSANSANEYRKEKRAQHAVPVCNICFQPIRLFNVRSLKLIYGDIFKAVQQGVHFAECNGSSLCHAVNGIFGDYALDLQSSFYQLPQTAQHRTAASHEHTVFVDVTHQFRRRFFQNRLDCFDDVGDHIFHGFKNFQFADLLHLRQTADQIPSLDP